MDIEKLIERLYKHHTDWGEGRTQDFFEVCLDCKESATALSTLQAENEKLRAEVESLQKEHCAGCSIPAVKAEQIRDLTDAPKLRAGLEQVKRERDAAVKDLEKLCHDDVGPCEMAICELCAYNNGAQCSRNDGQICDGYDVFNWKWRGPQKED